MNQLSYQLLFSLIGVIFGAGVSYGAIRGSLRRVQKDLNGLGGRQRRFEKNIELAMMAIFEDRRDRELLARFLKE